MISKARILVAVFVATAVLAGCGSEATTEAPKKEDLNVHLGKGAGTVQLKGNNIDPEQKSAVEKEEKDAAAGGAPSGITPNNK